jgi:sodium transport system permease protein
MTTATLAPVRQPAGVWIQVAGVATAMAILLLRPQLAAGVGWTVPVVVAVFSVVLLLGLAPPIARPAGGAPHSADAAARWAPGAARMVAVLVAGASVFVGGRLLAGGHPPVAATGSIVVLNTYAAFAEEAVFRRLAFAVLLPAGPAAAIGGSALLFGLAHVTVYGWWALPVDVGAGLVFGWQRWASGSWAVSAVTHAFADLLVVV